MKTGEFIRLTKRNGWRFQRQGKGSHEVWEKDGDVVIIPNHPAKELPKGLEKSLKKQMGCNVLHLSKSDFNFFLR